MASARFVAFRLHGNFNTRFTCFKCPEQPLSLLVKQHPLVTSLSLYDVRGSPGVAADIRYGLDHTRTQRRLQMLLILMLTQRRTRSHINTPAKTEGFLPDNDGLKKALEGAEVVLIPAGVPRKPGMTRDDLFNVRDRPPFAMRKPPHIPGLTRVLFQSQSDQRLHCEDARRGLCQVLP